uniref:DUF29 domain-containing protein n=1 Tax=Desulfatirhabdium butyrativorans TaxID=340467 RepID=A0A7C4RSV9_9BACT
MSGLYEQDFYGWTIEQANLLRTGALSQLDVKNLIEEVESMGRSEKKELVNRLAILITHLLKWEFQPERRGRSWELTIREQRLKLSDHLRDNPSLTSVLEVALTSAYRLAMIKAIRETGLPESTFPEACPFTVEQIMGESHECAKTP